MSMASAQSSQRFWQRAPRWGSPQASVLGFVVLACFSLPVYNGLHIADLRTAALENGQKGTANLARSIAQHAEDTIRTVDGILIGVVERVEVDGRETSSLERLRRLFQDRTETLSRLKGLAILDENGIVIVDSLPTTQRVSFADRDYFEYHRSHPDRGLHIGKPVRNTAVGDLIIPLSRRINHPDGSFAGVALAMLDTAYFQRFYDSFEIGKNGSILLASDDGTLLAQRPFVEAIIGRNLLSSAIFRDYLPKNPVGNAEMKSSADGVVRLNSYRRVEGYPLLVAVAESTDEILADWWAGAKLETLRVSALAMAMALLGMLLSRRTNALGKQSALLEATLDNMNQGLIVVDNMGRLPICNRRATELLNLPASLMGAHPHVKDVIEFQAERGEFVDTPEDVRSRLMPKIFGEQENSYERTRPNGTILEIRTVPFADGGVVRTFTDITARSLAEHELRERERLLRLLADNTTDVITRLGPDLRHEYVSPASSDLLGYEPAERVGRHAVEIVHPADRSQWAEALANSQGEAQTQASYRALRKDGSYVWVEENRRRLPASDGFVVSIRDISKRKEAEKLLEEANGRLEVLAREDALTGLANRRQFDELIEIEFGRAMRDGVPLSLIMIDVDRFKQFNDKYGHTAGDECLSSIALALKGVLQRPADIAARYGGEELAVLLPNTPQAGALAIAERMRRAVRALGIAHDANPDRLVTISLGVGCLLRRLSARRPRDLIEAADAALYAAKERGRDITCGPGDLHKGNVFALRR
jgi:diguanylate cyclase (GGDEF)-like protein/PAS domain S-box-containing protein